MPTFYLDYENGSDSSDGTSWVNAWKTITSGTTASRIAAGDVIRIAKSPAPYTISSGSWTNLSKTITLISASQTANIDMCETAWTANGSGDTTVTRQGTTWKQGTYAMTLTLDSSPQTNTMQAYYTITNTDFSSFQKISFWIRNSAAIVDGNWKVTLCSDTGGTTAVDTFAIPAIPTTALFVPLTLARIGGGNLGSSIQSIAITTGSAAPTASSNIIVDDFIACTTNGLNLQSLISKNSTEQGGTEAWYGIESISGSTILLGNGTNCLISDSRGYVGTTEYVPTYARETIKINMVTSEFGTEMYVQDSGTEAGGYIEFQGGYDTGTSLQSGETFYDGLNGRGSITTGGRSWIKINRLNTTRFTHGIHFSGYLNYIENMFTCCNSSHGIRFYDAYICRGVNLISVNNGNDAGQIACCNILFAGASGNTVDYGKANGCLSSGLGFDGGTLNFINTIEAINNLYYGVHFLASADNTVISAVTGNENYGGVAGANGGYNYVYHHSHSGTGQANYNSAAQYSSVVGFKEYSGQAFLLYTHGSAVTQTATGGGTGLEWKVSVTNVIRSINHPIKLKLAEIGVIANAQVTVTCYFKKSHATDIGGRLVCPAYQLDGVNETYTTCPEDTNRNQLQIQFTPTESGVLKVEAWIYWVANTADEYVLIDQIDVSQG